MVNINPKKPKEERDNYDNETDRPEAIIPWMALGWLILIITVVLILAFCVKPANAQTSLPPLADGCDDGWFELFQHEECLWCDKLGVDNLGTKITYYCTGKSYFSSYHQKWVYTIVAYIWLCDYPEPITAEPAPLYITHLPIIHLETRTSGITP